MEDWILGFISDFGYLGVFLLIMIENIFPPIPSEVILTFSGFATTTTELTKFGVIVASTAGSVAGAFILYWIGTFLDTERLEIIIKKYGKLLQLKMDDIHKTVNWFNKYGIWTVLFCRVIPLLRSLISLPAGMAKMNFPLFAFFTTIGTLTWNTILVNVGASVGENWESIVNRMDSFSNAVYALIVITGLVVFVLYMRFRNKRKKENFV